MINCPICGGVTRVRGGSYGDCETTYRRHICVDCGHSTYTEERESKGARWEYAKARSEANRLWNAKKRAEK